MKYGYLLFFLLGMGAQQLALTANKYQRDNDPKIWKRGDKVELINGALTTFNLNVRDSSYCNFWYIDGQATSKGNAMFLGYKCNESNPERVSVSVMIVPSEYVRKVLE